MGQSQEILLGHAIFASSKYGYHGYRRIARSISNKRELRRTDQGTGVARRVHWVQVPPEREKKSA